MGFLENLRRRKEAQGAEAERIQQQRIREEAIRTQQREAERLAEEVVSRRLEQAKIHFHQSGIEELVEEMGKLVYAKFGEIIYRHNPNKEEDVYVRSVWLNDPFYNGNREATWTFFNVSTTAEGVMRFEGGNSKSSSEIGRKLWVSDRRVLEEAMGRAYDNPQSLTVDPSTSINIYHGWG